MSAFKPGDKVLLQAIECKDTLNFKNMMPRYSGDGKERICHSDDLLIWVKGEVSRVYMSYFHVKYSVNGVTNDITFDNEERPDLEGWPVKIRKGPVKEMPNQIQIDIDTSDLVERVYIEGCGGAVKARKWAVEQFAPAIKRRLREWPVCKCGRPVVLDADNEKDGKEWVLRPVFKCECK